MKTTIRTLATFALAIAIIPLTTAIALSQAAAGETLKNIVKDAREGIPDLFAEIWRD